MQKAVFLDRDGVINELLVDRSQIRVPLRLSEFRLLPKVKEAIRLFKDAGFLSVVVTNKPDLATGLLTLEEMNKMHDFMKRETGLEIIYYCPHIDADECLCRKPEPGMILQAAKDHGIDLEKSFMIGDRWKDIHAGLRVGCKTVLVTSQQTIADRIDFQAHFCFETLFQSALFITQQV